MKNKFKTVIGVLAAVFALYLLIYYWPAVSVFIGVVAGAALPLILGGMIAYVLNIVMSFYERHFFPKSRKKFIVAARRPLSMVGAVLTVLAIIALVVVLVVPQFVSCVKLIVSKVPAAFDKVVAYIATLNIFSEEMLSSLSSVNLEGMIGKIASAITTGIGGAMNAAMQIISSVLTGVFTALISIIFAIYILASKDKIGARGKRAAKQYLSEVWYSRLGYLFDVVDDCFHKYIVGQCVEAVVLGSLCALGMLILGLPYVPMISALIAFTALIPVAGAYIGAGLGAFIILMDSPIKALIFIVFIIILQQLEGNIIYPKVVGSSVGLPGIWVLAAVTVGGGIMGVFGMLLAVPLVATAYRLIRADVAKREEAAKSSEAETEIAECEVQ